jgi:hypothetical protein
MIDSQEAQPVNYQCLLYTGTNQSRLNRNLGSKSSFGVDLKVESDVDIYIYTDKQTGRHKLPVGFGAKNGMYVVQANRYRPTADEKTYGNHHPLARTGLGLGSAQPGP